jgi:hypothetical protein
MIVKELYFGDDAREKLRSGIKKLARAVKSTLGASGKYVAIESGEHTGGLTTTKDGVTVANSVYLDDPIENLAVRMVKQAAQNTATAAGDGPQPLYANVLTPNGWKKMGDIKVGDEICSTDGSTQKVLGTFEKGNLEIYEVVLSDGRVVECSKDHLWTVIMQWGTEHTLPTHELGKFNGSKYLPVPNIEMNDNDLTIDPYLLGLLLGDGALGSNGSVELSLGYNKAHVLDKIVLPEGISINSRDCKNKNYIRAKFVGGMHAHIEELGLLDTSSHTKFIPKNYLLSSKKTRMALLAGLLDTDGCINKRGLFEFSTVSDQLADDFTTLITSLGYQFNRRLHTRKKDSGSYSNNPIHRIVQLKGYSRGIKIKEFRSTGRHTEMRCIKVSNDNHLYITDGMVPTHNTTTSIVLAEAIIENANNLIREDNNKTEVTRHIKSFSDKIIKNLEKRAKKLTGRRLYHVATVSANNDKFLGKLIGDAYKYVGKNGVVTVRNSRSTDTYVENIDGMLIERGYNFKYYINDERRNECVLEKPVMLVFDQELPDFRQIEHILEYVVKHNRSLLVIGELSLDASQTFAYNVAVQKTLKGCHIIPPSFGNRREEMMQDICTATGATYISDKLGNDWNTITPSDLGEADRVVVNESRTVLINDTQKVETVDLISDLNAKLKDESNENRKEAIRERVSALNGMTRF